MQQKKISIIGAGAVGSTIAYSLMLKNVPCEISLVDIDTVRCRGEILDLSDTLINQGGQSTLSYGSADDAGKSDIIIIAAGERQKVGQSRLGLLEKNKEIIQSIIATIEPINKQAIIIMVSNPVDYMAFFAQKYSKLPHCQVIGSGTFLDTQRLRQEISKKTNISQDSIHAYVIGEHGDNQFAAWSSANIAGKPLIDFKFTDKELETMSKTARDKAYEIIACKGSTYYGIASCVAALCRTVIFDQKRVTPVSCFVEKYQLYMSLPVVLGAQGVESIIDIPLSSKESKQLDECAQVMQKSI